MISDRLHEIRKALFEYVIGRYDFRNDIIII